MQIGRKMTEFEAFEVLSVVLEHPVFKIGEPIPLRSYQTSLKLLYLN